MGTKGSTFDINDERNDRHTKGQGFGGKERGEGLGRRRTNKYKGGGDDEESEYYDSEYYDSEEEAEIERQSFLEKEIMEKVERQLKNSDLFSQKDMDEF